MSVEDGNSLPVTERKEQWRGKSLAYNRIATNRPDGVVRRAYGLDCCM